MFFNQDNALTYDDVLLMPQYSEVLPTETKLSTKFSKNITLSIPLASSAMDTVTESKTAIKMAELGGIGVIHKNLTIEEQTREVLLVKKYVAGMVQNPKSVKMTDTLEEIKLLIEKYSFSGFPVVDDSHQVIGMVTNRDIRFEENLKTEVSKLMTKEDKLITGKLGISLSEAKNILKLNRIEKLPITEKNSKKLVGLITIKDIEKSITYPHANLDQLGRLRCAAAIGVGEKEYDRAISLLQAGVDAIVVDTAHGHSKGVIEMVKKLTLLKGKYTFDIVAGNVATSDGCADLIKTGADAIKVGIGPGSICTTRVVSGVGVPQLQALLDCKTICEKNNIPFIADGGIKYSGDIVKALAVGASTVMIGSLFAGTDEAPGERVLYQGRVFKTYRGMGSLGAMVLGSKDRYGQGSVEDLNKLVPEGIEGQVPYRGPLSENIYQLLGGIRSGMGYLGAIDLAALKEKAKFIKITSSSLKEGHPHDITITKEAPNYHQG